VKKLLKNMRLRQPGLLLLPLLLLLLCHPDLNSPISPRHSTAQLCGGSLGLF